MSIERSKAPLALMEQIIMILVFALTAAVCIRAFVYSSSVSKKGANENIAANYAQEIAEYIKTSHGDEGYLCDALSGEKTDEGVTFTYKEDNMTGTFSKVESNDYLEKGVVKIFNAENEVLFSLQVAWQKEGETNE